MLPIIFLIMENIENSKPNMREDSSRLYETLKKLKTHIEDLHTDAIDWEGFKAKISAGWADGMSDSDIVDYVAQMAASMTAKHPEYAKLASRTVMAHIHEVTMDNFVDKIIYIQKHRGIIHEEMYKIILNHRDTLNDIIKYERDYNFTYFAILTLSKAYLLRVNGSLVERPQDLLLRVAIQLHKDNMELVKDTYNLLSMHYYTHATPTLYNSCLRLPQLASCFLICPKEDSIEGLYDLVKQCAVILKFSGGVGLNLHSIRAKGSELKRTGGRADGLIPFIKVLDTTVKFVNQGGDKRPGAFAVYLEPWHKEVFDFLELKKNTGPEHARARSIFMALWVSDLFMERVQNNDTWSLFCPSEAHGLCDVWGEEFNKLYVQYEKTLSRTVIPAQKLWKAIIEAQIETGAPFILYKDTANRLSNQNHLGTIKSSNLCTEILQYTSPDEIAVCNLASICLPRFVINGRFDFELLRTTVKKIVVSLNSVIDSNYYPAPEAELSNFKHRPIGIGVQGLADLFIQLRMPFESEQARKLNREVFETMYYGALESSCELAEKYGPYKSFEGSLLSKGIFHHELANRCKPSGMWDWDSLRFKIQQFGARNSLLIAPMPTSSTSQIFNNNEAFEPYTSNIYTRRTHAGEFQVINTYLMEDLIKLNLWSYEMKNLLIEHEGSIQNIPGIPSEIKDLYKTAWEVKMKSVIDLAADRQSFIDQSQSMNIFIREPTYSQLTSMHFYGYKAGLKTGMYYLRTRPITSAIKFTVDQKLLQETLTSLNDIEKDGDCLACSS